MASNEINMTVRVRKCTQYMVMNVTIVDTKEFKIRKAIAVWLIKLATLVLGCGLEVKEE